jgi:hypothetical protein
MISEQEQVLDKWVGMIQQYKLEMPALSLLYISQPLSLLFAQFLWVAQPTLNILQPQNQLAQWATLLEQPDTIPTFIAKLEGADAS